MNPTRRTDTEIETEIATLEGCKQYIPKRTSFGDDNHAQLDLQIEALKFGIDTTSDEWLDWSERDRDAITQALDWKCGTRKESPASEWDAYKHGLTP